MIWKLLFVVIVAAHFALVVGVAASIPWLVLNEPWYVSMPLITWIVNLSMYPGKCPLTVLENYARVRIGLKPIRGFVGHWILFRKDMYYEVRPGKD